MKLVLPSIVCVGLVIGACSTKSNQDDSQTARGGSGTTSQTGAAGSNNGDNSGSANGGNGNQTDAGQAGQAGGEGGNNNGDAGTATGGSGGDPNSGTGDGGTGPMPIGDGSACGIQTQTHPSEGAFHLAECTVINYGTNPPSSGNHYPVWAAFGVYEFPLPRGYWMHNLEHGAVVITYNCPDGCDADLQAAIAWFNALPVDAACQLQGAPMPRALLLPDPLLDVKLAASSWLHTLRADCFDEAAFSDFYDSNVGQGLENVCSSGAEFRGPDGAPTAALTPGCGE